MPERMNGFFTEIIGYLAVALGAITMWAWKRTHNELDTKASMITVDNLVHRFEIAATAQREDTRKLFDEISKAMDLHNRFVEKALDELGKRPTREECMASWLHHRSGDVK